MTAITLNAEQRTTAKLAAIDAGTYYRGMPDSELLGYLPASMHSAVAPAPKPAPAASSQPVASVNPYPTTPVPGTATDVATAIQAAIQAAIGATPAQMDEARVRAIAAEAIQAATGLPRVLHVETTNPVTGERVTIEGAHPALAVLHRRVKLRKPVSLVGPAGTGKTTLARQLAEMLGLPLYIQAPASHAMDYLGYRNPAGEYQATEFYKAFKNGGVCLLDEHDGSDQNAPLAINGGIENRVQAFPHETIEAHPNFILLAAMNTYGRGADRTYVGRNQMDGAALDRFMPVECDYDSALELALATAEFTRHAPADASTAPAAAWVARVQAYRAAAAGKRVIISMRASINGAGLLALGETVEEAEAATVWKGLAADTVTQIKATAGVR